MYLWCADRRFERLECVRERHAHRALPAINLESEIFVFCFGCGCRCCCCCCCCYRRRVTRAVENCVEANRERDRQVKKSKLLLYAIRDVCCYGRMSVEIVVFVFHSNSFFAFSSLFVCTTNLFALRESIYPAPPQSISKSEMPMHLSTRKSTSK